MRKNICQNLIVMITLYICMFAVFWLDCSEVKAASYPGIMLKVPYFPQKVSGDCGISSIAMIEAYALGYDKTSFNSVYSAVYAANGNSLYIDSACSNGKYIDISMDLPTFYNQLAAGKPILIRREPYEHWSVIVGYNGSSTTLETSGFIVWDTKRWKDGDAEVANYNEVTGGKTFNLSRWLKAPNWNGSAYVDQGSTSLVRARVRGTGAIGSSSGNTEDSCLKATGVTNITDTTARINASISPGANVTESGFYLGTSPDGMAKVEDKASGYAKSIFFDLGTGKWTGALNKATTYYYQIYAIINGITYKSAIDSFTTTGDGTPPTITNVQVTNVTRDGYTVTCNVEDNQGGTGVERVSFPTWSDVNGQDDLSADWYNACAVYPSGTGNTYTFNVNVANHGYAEGGYTTHIYAYDKAGNYSMEAVFATINRQIPLESFTLSQNQLNVAINQTEQLSVTSYTPSNTTSDKTATWQSSNASVVTVDGQGNVTGIKTGTATITCTVAGKTQSCEVTVSDVILKDFSGWVDCLPDEVSNNATKYEIQEKTQYRSRTKAETTSTTPNLSGWNVSNEWWGDWQQCGADVIGTATREVRQEQQYVKTQWAYNHWHNTSNGNVSPVQYSGWVYHETGWLDYQLTPSGTSNAGGTKYLCSSKIGPCSYQGPWYNETKQDVYNTLYYYRDKYFNYYQWSDWSDWSDAVVSASANVEIETRTLYRYRYNAVELLSNPDNQSVDLGETATFTVSATGIGLTYQWQYSKDDGKTWSNATVNDISYSIEATELMEGWLYRCVVTDGKGNSVTSESAKLTVKIPLKTYTITYNLKGGKNNKANPATYTEGSDTITLKAPTKTGYTFGGWYSDSSYKTKVIQINTVSNKDINLYAKWTANKYTIKFHKNGATSGSMNAMNNRKYGSSYTLSANKFKRKGYSFKDWNTKKNGSGKTYKNKESVKNLVSANGKSITLYAQWEKKSYKITYKLNGGTNKSTNPKQYDVTTKTITLKAPTRKGYIFKGWYKDSKFKKQIKKITKGSTGNITLYAKWEKK